ncbi:unnamed protein product [Paramecium primaurelia]|uniref:Uncharacterized protein n=1 Tax=Paramecium primaurelia TaxID=5886 RepID=A0A8S1QGD3_PARPR|nr:unnamed protein product [Paramecium primaurelia]
MVLSNDGTFELTFVDPFRQCKGKPLEYKHIMTPEGICVIGEVDQHFILNVECKDKGVYGIRVIVDGYTLPGKKTFKSKCKIQGFTNSEGNINCFKFQRPKSDPESTNVFKRNVYRPPWDLNQNDYRDYPGGAGEIIVKIYETKQEENTQSGGGGGGGPRGGGARKSQDPMFVEVTKNENKQAQDQCLGISQGNVIELPPRQAFDDSRPPKPFKDVIVYEHIVQSFRVIYFDAASLVEKGYVKLNCHNHITYLTEEFFQGNEAALIQVLQTLIESGQKDKEEQDIQQTANVLVERLDYFFSGELLNIFQNKENQEQMQLDPGQRAQYLESELIKFMEGWPDFFQNLGMGAYGIKTKYEQKIYIDRIQEKVINNPIKNGNEIQQQ